MEWAGRMSVWIYFACVGVFSRAAFLYFGGSLHQVVLNNPEELKFSNESGIRGHVNSWYKDERGGKHYVKLHLSLLDHCGKPVLCRAVPLRAVLLYEDRNEVENQEILKAPPKHEKEAVIDEKGVVQLILRIEDVSKNHQKKVCVCLCV